MKPETGESFSGWLNRYAHTYGIPTGLLVDSLHIPTRHSAVDAHPVWADILLTPPTAEALAETTGLEREHLHGAFAESLAPALVDLSGLDPDDERSLRTVAAIEGLLTSRSRACGRCLQETGTWRTWWRLGMAAVCPTHRVVLADDCPGCGHPLFSGHRYLRTREPIPTPQCGRSARGAICTFHLPDLSHPPAPAQRSQAKLPC